MYRWLWARLPGPPAVRLLLAAVCLAAVVVLLFTQVFPAVARWLPSDNPTNPAAQGGSALLDHGMQTDAARDG